MSSEILAESEYAETGNPRKRNNGPYRHSKLPCRDGPSKVQRGLTRLEWSGDRRYRNRILEKNTRIQGCEDGGLGLTLARKLENW